LPASSEPVDSINLVLSIDQNKLLEGQVYVNSQLHNGTVNEISFLRWNTPLASSIDGAIFSIAKKNDGELTAVDYQGIMIKRLPPRESDYLTVSSGKNVDGFLDITNSYKFCAGAEYIIEFEGVFISPNNELAKFTSNSPSFTYTAGDPDC